MMTALDFLKQRARMCDAHWSCDRCPINNENNYDEEGFIFCKKYLREYPEKVIAIVEQWAEEHPPKTRQSEFLKIFPNASIADGGYINIDPCEIDQTLHCQRWTDEACSECKRKYWLSEVSEDGNS